MSKNRSTDCTEVREKVNYLCGLANTLKFIGISFLLLVWGFFSINSLVVYGDAMSALHADPNFFNVSGLLSIGFNALVAVFCLFNRGGSK